MKFTFETKKLLKALEIVVQTVGDGKIIQAYRSVLISVDSGGKVAELFSTNIGVRGSVEIGVDSEEDIRIGIPCKELYEWVKTRDSEAISFEVLGGRVKVKSGKSQLTLVSISEEEYGAWRGAEEVEGVIKVSGDEFMRRVSACEIAVARDAREELASIYIDFSRKVVVGADGNRVMLVDGWGMDGEGMLIPGESVAVMVKVLKLGCNEVEVCRRERDGELRYEVGGMKVRIGFSYLAGKYIAYWPIAEMAEKASERGWALKRDWVDGLRSVRVFQPEEIQPLRVEGENGELVISNKESAASIGTAREVIDGEVVFNFRAYFNLMYLLDGIGQMKDGKVEIRSFKIDKISMWLFTDGELRYLVAPYSEPDSFDEGE